MPPVWLVRLAVALVWIYQGLWCKLLGRMPQHDDIVADVPLPGFFSGRRFLLTLGVVEVAIGVWILSGWHAWWVALLQTAMLLSMNALGLAFARKHIQDPGGMLAKNFALLVLAWVAAAHGD